MKNKGFVLWREAWAKGCYSPMRTFRQRLAHGRNEMKIGGEWRWIWNVMDERTRSQLVSVITKTREIQDAKKAFRKSKEVSGKKPMLMVTDGLASYRKAFNSEFYDHHQSSKHVADVGLQESLNNVLERMHGSIREREKVMEGIKVDDTPIIPMNQIYYNFIRPAYGT